MIVRITDEDFDSSADVWSIKYRLHPLDVGFDLRASSMPILVSSSDDPIRVSYPDHEGCRRVMSGPQSAVIARLEDLGFAFVVE